MRNLFLKYTGCFLIVVFISPLAFAQLGKITFDLAKDKPAKFKTQTLKSEKTGQKKFTFARRLMQNTVSHYNYYFNANNKINEVIEKARIINNDIYYKLLPFYSYSLTNTAQQATELDSVIYKATAGILLHDLRSEWVDNFYLLIGRAYLLKRAFDSASMTFQFINYNLYPKNKKDEEQVIVGSNVNNATKTISIANKENIKPLAKVFSLPPSRNDALVWQIRALIEMEEYSEAAGIINTLHNDINFPARLNARLEEVNAYWFYKQGMYDSAANHLENALSNARDLQEKARSEYLLAQLFQRSGNFVKASDYYKKAISHTTDPLLDIYANLSEAKMFDSSGGINGIDNSIAQLLRMAKRDKFENYRNLIYYSAGELALEKPDTAAAEFFIKKSLSFNESEAAFKNKAFLKLADISFARKDYKAAFSYYDSLQTGDSSLVDLDKIQEKRGILSKIVNQLNIIEREDSLQRLALLSPTEREAFIKALAKKLKKEAGVKEGDNFSASPSSVFENKNIPADIFASGKTKGDWYFYNSSVKAKGYTDFISKWGKRQNIDNWRTVSDGETPEDNADDSQAGNGNDNNVPRPGIDSAGDIDAVTNTGNNVISSTSSNAGNNISYEGLLENVPTTIEKLNVSNTLLSNALFELAKLLQSDLEDYKSAVETYHKSLERYPDSLYGGELYMNLYYCYQKLGDMAKANYYKNLVTANFAGSKFAQHIKNPAAARATKNPEATKRYEAIYTLFIEGQFEKALLEKKAADSVYANNYWTPQLLYIESVYYIKQKEDSLAIDVLNNIVTSYPNSLLKNRAETMIDVLKRRQEIEDYLTNLTIERYKDDEILAVTETSAPKQIRDDKNLFVKKDSIVPKKDSMPVIDNVVKKPVQITEPPTVVNNPDSATPPVLNPVADRDSTPPVTINTLPEKDSIPPPVPDPVANRDSTPPDTVPALAEKDNTPPLVVNTPPVKDKITPSVENTSGKDKAPPVVNTSPGKDKITPPLVSASFNFVPEAPQFVVMLLDKVDPVYISEARNAFLRYNREKFAQSNIEIVREVVDKDRSLLVFRQFTNAGTAVTYSAKIKKDAALEVSWLPANKYSFFIISEANLQLLKLNKDLQKYLKILQEALPGQF